MKYIITAIQSRLSGSNKIVICRVKGNNKIVTKNFLVNKDASYIEIKNDIISQFKSSLKNFTEDTIIEVIV